MTIPPPDPTDDVTPATPEPIGEVTPPLPPGLIPPPPPPPLPEPPAQAAPITPSTPPPPEPPTQAAPTTPATPPGRRNTAARVALILGIVAIVFSVIPFLSYVAWAIGIAAIVLGIIGLTRVQWGRKGSAITGLVLGVLALILSIVLSVVYTVVFFLAAVTSSVGGVGGLGGLPTDLPSDLQSDLPSDLPTDFPSDPDASFPTASPTPGQAAVVYRVTGAGKAGTITYLAVGGLNGQDQVQDVTLPWSKAVAIGDAGSTTAFSLEAQRDSGTGTIGCEIEVAGKVVSKHTASGANALVTCTGTAG